MAKGKKVWMYCPKKPPKPKVPDSVKRVLTAKAQQLIDDHLKPQHIKPPPKDAERNYVTELFTRWYQSYFYFCSTYACPYPDALSPTFELRFARMGYQGDGKFNLAYMRHTGQWDEIYFSLTMDECLQTILEEPHFIP